MPAGNQQIKTVQIYIKSPPQKIVRNLAGKGMKIIRSPNYEVRSVFVFQITYVFAKLSTSTKHTFTPTPPGLRRPINLLTKLWFAKGSEQNKTLTNPV